MSLQNIKCDNFNEYAVSQIEDALRRTSTSKALGTDRISPIMLKKLGENGIKFLTKLVNLSGHFAHVENYTTT